jgi:cell division protein FtsL
LQNDQRATLGCGTLILIALIVLIFGNMSGDRADRRINELNQNIQNLDMKVQQQSQEIKELRKDISELLRIVREQANEN